MIARHKQRSDATSKVVDCQAEDPREVLDDALAHEGQALAHDDWFEIQALWASESMPARFSAVWEPGA